MSNLTENIYDINDLYVVEFKDEIKNIDKYENVKYFNRDLFFIVEKTTIESNNQRMFTEYYVETITGEDIYKREGYKEFSDIPDIFVSMVPLYPNYIDNLDKDKLSTKELFLIFQDINTKAPEKSKPKTKTKSKSISKAK